MNDDTSTERQAPRRSLKVLAFGDSADEVELAALDQARAFFGTDRQLQVLPDYSAFDVRPEAALAAQSKGKKFYASVTVCTVEP